MRVYYLWDMQQYDILHIKYKKHKLEGTIWKVLKTELITRFPFPLKEMRAFEIIKTCIINQGSQYAVSPGDLKRS